MARTSAARASRPDIRAGRPLTRRALDYATEHHAGQRRDTDGAPYVMHPVEVASLLYDSGYPDHVVAAGVLHDVLEDTDAERAEIESGFGPEVAGLVTALTEDDSIEDSRERKAALRLQVARAGDEAAAVFAADKVSKAREMRHRAAQRPLDESDAGKIEHYRESLDMLVELIPDHVLVAQLRSEVEALRPASSPD
jgi:(p)ppGpp synthase/HD superfamily hydrolase